MKKVLFPILGLILALGLALPMAPGAQAYKEGPSTNWYYIDAQYVGWHNSGTLEIELNGNPAAGQVFAVGDTITISGDVHAYAAMCGSIDNEAYTDTELSVNGPSGPDSDSAGGYDYEPVNCAEVDTDTTLTITYSLTDPGTHTVYMYSYAAVAWGGSDIDEDFLEALLTFEVLENFVTGGGKINANGNKAAWTFGGTVGVALVGGGIVGQFQIVDHEGKEAWHCNNNFSALSFSGGPAESPPASHDTATFEGTFTSNRGSSAVLTVTIKDLGEPGAGVDKIEVTGDPTIGETTINGGNFQVHDIELTP